MKTKKNPDPHYDQPTCTIDHADGSIPKKLAGLPTNQRGDLRHRCAGCAYLMGIKDGMRMAATAAKGKKSTSKNGQKSAPAHAHH